MNWKEINTESFPKCEVLAINDREELLMGWLWKTTNNTIKCEHDTECIWNVTHYIEVSNIPKPKKENQ
jgi:hypothetical protein